MSKNNIKTNVKKGQTASHNPQIIKSDQKVKQTIKTSSTISKNSTILKNKDPIKDEEKKVVTTKKVVSKVLNNRSSPSTSSTLPKQPIKTARNSKNDNQNLNKDLSHRKTNTKTVKRISNPKGVISNKPNLVKDTYHNVTIASPPSLRKKQSSSEFDSLASNLDSINSISEAIPNQAERRNTITLNQDEIVVLNKDISQNQQNDKTFHAHSLKKKFDVMGEDIINQSVENIKEPVAFEIKFQDKENNFQTIKDKKNEVCYCSDEYEDDFDSYESDFETGSSSAEGEVISDTASESKIFNSDEKISKSEKSQENSIIEDDDDYSEETQPPITVIQRREKDTERKLDSGNYDMKTVPVYNKILEFQINQQSDSLDTTTINSERLDSGLGTLSKYGTSEVYWSKAENSNYIPTFSTESKRGFDLMKKIKLDEISYHLFELKPMNYEYFMKIYGNLNTLQTSTQTRENTLNFECQTDEYQIRSMWTQHPPYFDTKNISNKSKDNPNLINRNFIICGEEELIENDEIVTDNIQFTIKALQKFKRNELKRNEFNLLNQKVDFELLNQFLNRVKVTIFEILNRNCKVNETSEVAKPSFSSGFRKLNANFLNALKVVKIFSKPMNNFILTVHESADEIYKNEFQNLIVVWSTSDLINPIRLLSSWSHVCKVDICTVSSNIIVSGLKDGSIAMWDLRETNSYCSKLDGYLSHFAATQSIVPSFGNVKLNKNKFDLGSVVDIKSFKPESGAYLLKAYKQIQFVSLNDTGILTIWSLIEIEKQEFSQKARHNSYKINDNKIEFSSPWAKVKLVQSAICDLCNYLEIKRNKIQSKFEQTLLYFKNDIYNDEILQELQKTNENRQIVNQLHGLRFTTLDTSSNMIYIATNRNFILVCSKTLKSERFRKIHINDSVFMFPTAIRLHPNEEFLIVGLSNGSVIAVNCNENKPKSNTTETPVTDDSAKFLAAKSNPDSIEEIEMKKIQSSCAIQNMIRNERKNLNGDFEQQNLYFKANSDFRPRTAIQEFEETNFKQNSCQQYKIYDQQVLLNGSVIRKNLVGTIEITLDGTKLYCLSDGDLKIFDCSMGTEINSSKNYEIKGLCLTKAQTENGHYVIFLKDNNIVEIYKPK